MSSAAMTGRIFNNRYQITERIGIGGMAEVYQAQDNVLGRRVAVKVMLPQYASDAAFAQRFRQEAASAANLQSPYIVNVYDWGQDDGTYFIVMEYIRGTDLKTGIVQRGALNQRKVAEIGSQVCQALSVAHNQDIIHRDIKPQNIMVQPDGNVKVMDFGIARAVSDSSSTVAETTQILGTAAYFSPEQAKGEPVDARTDVYSTGVVLYELLTGRQPFRGESPVAVAYQHVSEAPLPPTEVNEDAPRALDPIVLRAMAKDPYQRYPDAASFRLALDSAMSGKEPTKKELGALTSELYGPSPRQAQETARSLRQLSTDTTMTRTQSGPPVAWIWAGVALLAVLLVSVLLWVLMMPRGEQTPADARLVPDLVDMSYERAQSDLLDLDLQSTVVYESHATTAEHNVVRTDPEAGQSVKVGQRVTLYVSTGAETVEVPPLIGLSQAAATQALTDAGLQLGSVTQKSDTASQADIVLEVTNVKEGAKVAPSTVVNLIVASGRIELRDVTSWPVDAATAELERLGLNVTTSGSADCPATTPATVSSMSLPPGDVPVHSEVELRYCTGE